jgi:hypothetical protein
MDLSGPLRSLRDTLRNLHARIADDFPRADRVTRLMLKVNALLQAQVSGSQSDADALRRLTEQIASVPIDDGAAIDILLDALEELLISL